MILQLHSSMGDHVILTGIPEAFYKLFGEKTHVPNKYSDLFWEHNPYVTDKPTGDRFGLHLNASAKDYMIYYPVRVFYDLTQYIVDRSAVQPNLYMSRTVDENLVIVSDQAGWPNRRGYPFLNDLVLKLQGLGFYVMYIRSDGYKDCFGQHSPRQLTVFDNELQSPIIGHLIDAMRRAAFYIGYDSGIAQIAGALKIPYVLLAGSVPPINTAHDTCIYAMDIRCKRCADPNCGSNCLSLATNCNEKIIEAIKNERARNTL